MSKGPVCIVLIRFVVQPIIGAVIVIGAAKLGICTPTNPVYLIILALQVGIVDCLKSIHLFVVEVLLAGYVERHKGPRHVVLVSA